MPSVETDEMSEKISALIDNELDELERARVLRDVARDPQLADAWSRYHVIGRAVRRELIVPEGDLADRVAHQLREEAVPMRPAGGSRSLRDWLSPAGSLAAAASVAAVLLVGGIILNMQEDTPVGGGTTNAEARVAFVEEPTRWEGADPETEDALNALLVEHGEFTAASGMNGLTAYTKFVAYDSR